MVRSTRLIYLACAALAAQAFSTLAFADVPVVDSQGTPAASRSTNSANTATSRSTSQSEVRSYGVDQNQAGVVASTSTDAPPSGSVNQGGAAELFTRFQQLEADVAELRGIVEEQNHQIEKLAQQQKEQYLDLDQRVALALKGQPTTATQSTPSTGGGAAGAGGKPTPTGSQGSASERDAYTAAFELTKQKRFNDAINSFNQMLVDYPNGQFSGNAFYWLGECYRALPAPDLEKSRQSFTQVISLYPTNQKVGDAMYKLGVVYHQLGDPTKALEYLSRVQTQFPATPAARLAQSYAAELR